MCIVNAYLYHTLHIMEVIYLAHISVLFGAIFSYRYVGRHKGSRPVMLGPVELNTAGNPGTCKSYHCGLDNLVVVYEIVIRGLLVCSVDLSTDLGKKIYLYVIILKSDLIIDDLVKVVFSNKLYISRAISQITGRNFCQFVNYYRIMYSVETFRANPELKVTELASLSGFNSLVSFSMAFRLYMNENPSDWIRKERTRKTKSGMMSTN